MSLSRVACCRPSEVAFPRCRLDCYKRSVEREQRRRSLQGQTLLEGIRRGTGHGWPHVVGSEYPWLLRRALVAARFLLPRYHVLGWASQESYRLAGTAGIGLESYLGQGLAGNLYEVSQLAAA